MYSWWFYSSFLFLYILDLGQGFVERCPTCSAILLLSHITDEGKRGDEGQESSMYLTYLCSARGEFCGITSVGKVCKHSSCLQGLKDVCQISNVLGTSRKWYQVVGAARV